MSLSNTTSKTRGVTPRSGFFQAFALAVAALAVSGALAADWPQWRYDGFHSATSPETLPGNMELQWIWNLPKPEAAWDAQKEVYSYGGPGLRVPQMLAFDIAYQPVVAGNMVYFNSPNSDRVTAADLKTGVEKWRFYTEGPVRFSPLVYKGKVYFGSDDGYLYCVDAKTGALLGKLKAGPDDRKVMGNDRLISKWCVRGAPMIPGQSFSSENPEYVSWRARLAAVTNVFQIQTADDDLEEKVAGGAMDVGSSDIEINYESTGGVGAQIIGLRFKSEFLRIPRSAAIDSAFIQFAVDETKGGTEPCTVTVYGEAADNSAPLSGNAFNLSSRNKTGAAVEWVIPPWTTVGTAGPDQRTPDIGGIITEITSRPGWQDANYITILIYGKGGTGIRCADARDENQKTAYLTIFSGQFTIDSVTNRPEPTVTLINPDSTTLYAASGLYPFEGTFVGAVNPDNGDFVWKNNGSSMFYTKQPHSTAEGYSGISPQGYLCAAGNKLIVPNGRGAPAVFDRATGKLEYFRLGDVGKLEPGYFVVGGATVFHNRASSYNLSDGRRIGNAPIMLNENDVAIKAGPRMYTAGKLFEDEIAGVTSTAITSDDGAFRATVDGRVVTMVAANGRLLASTDAGKIYCFGAGTAKRMKQHTLKAIATRIPSRFAMLAQKILSDAGYRGGSKGICVVNGLNDGFLVEFLARETDLTVIGFDEDKEKIDQLRRRLDDAGLYGRKAHLLCGDLTGARVPSHIASIIISEHQCAPDDQRTLITEAFRVLRPYGGTAILPLSYRLAKRVLMDCPNAKIEGRLITKISKVGPIPNSDQWTHNYANAAQTAFSNDLTIKLPLGTTWFGGSADNTNDKILPRHGHGLIPLVAGGRILQQGRDVLRSVDLYTGRVLWEKEIPNLGQYSDYTGHQTGHIGLGNNLVALADKVYVLGPQNRCGFSTNCLVLDAATGAVVKDLFLPGAVAWGMISVSDDYLITTSDLLQFDPTIQDCYTENYDGLEMIGPGAIASRNAAMGLRLFVLDRHTGRVLWQKDAASGFNHTAIAAAKGKMFVVDQTLKQAIDVMSRVGATVPAMTTPALYVLDIKTGAELWKKCAPEDSVFGTYLSYSAKHDLLVESQAKRSDYFNGEGNSKMAVYRASTGELVWKQLNRAYSGGPVMLDDTLIRTNGYTFNAINLLTGTIVTVPNPLTGVEAELTAQKHYGCTYATGCPNLLVVRSGAGGYIDIEHNAGAGNFGGFKTGCTPSLVTAEGVVASPEYTRTCGCSYQLQTSCVMVHEPENDVWLSNEKLAAQFKAQGGKIRNIGLNFGAPGDRFDAQGTLWLDFPQGELNAGGNNVNYVMPIDVTVGDPNARYVRHHSACVGGGNVGHSWIGASAIEAVGTIVVSMVRNANPDPQPYCIDLVFAETEGKVAGERVFNVTVNGVSTGPIDIAAEAGPSTMLVKTLENVTVGERLTIELSAIAGTPLLSGIRAIRSDLVKAGMSK